MKKILILLLVCGASLHAASTPDAALKTLMEGHQRFLKDETSHPDRTAERRLETAHLQEPFAIIVACSDSRVAPEIIFDQGIGDLFIVRVAGNVVGPIELESIEYGVKVLHAPLILVLGHENCGAIKAVMGGMGKDIPAIAELIEPAIEKSKDMPGNKTGDKLKNAVKTNALMVANQIRTTADLVPFIAQKKLVVQAGYYNFHTGEVEVLKK